MATAIDNNVESPLEFPICCHGHTARFVMIVMVMYMVTAVMMMMMCFLPKFHQSCRFLDSEGLDCGSAARDKKLEPYIKALKQGFMSYLTDFQKKDCEMRLDLMVAKVEEMTTSQDVHGLASILFGGSRQRTQNYYVLFHGGEQLFLTVMGKGRKLGMKGEWLAKVEVEESMGQYSWDQSRMEKLAAARGYNPHTMQWASLLNWPLGGTELDRPETTRCTGQFHRPGESVKR